VFVTPGPLSNLRPELSLLGYEGYEKICVHESENPEVDTKNKFPWIINY